MKKKYEKYKDINNAWLDPYGELHQCGYMGHEEWAVDFLKTKFNCGYIELMKKIEPVVGSYGYCNEYLCKQGWLRLLTWSNSIGTKIYGYVESQKPNGEQESTLLEWCSANDKKYDSLFEPINK